MDDLPRGTVTCLFSDIEGSTSLVQLLNERYPDVLAEHHRLLRAAVGQHEGHEVTSQGDGFFVVFAHAAQAVAAAVTGQRMVVTHDWPHDAPVRVRMGIHTGDPSRDGLNYVGLDVHRASRICSAGHGGQILLSQTTRDLVERDLPVEVSIRDLGSHRLKDLLQSERIFQLLIPGLESDFPPLRTLDNRPNNLPSQATPFIGRADEVGSALKRLRDPDIRLLTVIGPGGSGKTRLALEVAAEVLEQFTDGVYFVPLAALRDPELVGGTIAAVLGIRETENRSAIEGLKE